MHETVLVTGNFDVLHPGHIRLLNFAKECGKKLIVAVNSDGIFPGNIVHEKHRLEMIKALECVDEAFINKQCLNVLISNLKPEAIVKGKEFETQFNPEKDMLESYGGKLIFGSGDFEINSNEYIKNTKQVGSLFDFESLQGYIYRHKINLVDIKEAIKNFSKTNVAVIGEAIVDQYITGKAVGLSQEDPTIVMTPSSERKYLGGAAITAAHFKSLGAKQVNFLTIVGSDEHADFVRDYSKEYGLSSHIFEDSSRPTPLKVRYRVDNKTLLRVNTLRHHHISHELQQRLLDIISTIVKDINVLVFSDFNYGLLPDSLVHKICGLCEKNNVKLVADSQSSSQIGDISRYKNMYLITPTEKECRIALNDFNSGLVTLANQLCLKSNPKYLLISQGDEGCFVHIPDRGNDWKNDQLPAINKNAVDPAGAGDCFLATSTLALISGSRPYEAFLLATLAAASQVDRVGNMPLDKNILLTTVKACFL